MDRTISCCVWGLLSIIFYLFIVVTFNQECEYHTGIPVSILYVFVGCFIICDMYTMGGTMEAVFEAGSYDKNTNLVAHFIGSIYHVCICGY